MTDQTTKIPVTVLTGFLGAGKTTLLNRILTEEHGKKYAVIINEYGEAGIDEQLVTAHVDEEIFEVNNGCICCTVRGDLIRMVNLLMKRRDKFDGILIETTGLADPAPVAQTFFADPDVRARTRLDSIVCLVDAVNIAEQLATNAQAREQIAFADTLILNKIDATPDGGAGAKQLVQQKNPFATILTANHADVPLNQILDRGAFDLDRILTLEPSFIDDAATGHHHHHDDDISSISLTESKPLDEQKFEDWILTLLQERGQEILRTKGILSLTGRTEKYVFQAVHMMSEGQFTQPWADEKPSSTLVLIGKNLDRTALQSGFANCAT